MSLIVSKGEGTEGAGDANGGEIVQSLQRSK
jgi:hypothetical protein